MQLPTTAAVSVVPLMVQLPLLDAKFTAPVPLPPVVLKVVVVPRMGVVLVETAVSAAWLALPTVKLWVTWGAAAKLPLPA